MLWTGAEFGWIPSRFGIGSRSSWMKESLRGEEIEQGGSFLMKTKDFKGFLGWHEHRGGLSVWTHSSE